MTDWFRSWHGAPTDPKWLVIARKADVSPAIVSAIVWALFDYASQHSERGTVEGFDVETYAVWSGLGESDVTAVIGALEAKGVIQDGRLTNWEKRQNRNPSWYLRPPADLWEKLRRAVFARDDYTCRYCGARGVRLECDHIVPVSRGGSNELDNLTTACFDCNRSKGNQTVEEWRS